MVVMIKIGVIINGSVSLKKKASSALQLLENSPVIDVEIRKTTAPGEAISIAKNLAGVKQAIIAIGGDGTCNEVLNGWYIAANDNCAFGIIPSGTGNDFIRMLPEFDPQKFVLAVEQLDIQLIDFGVAKFATEEKAFLNIADVGFGAKVVALMDKQRKQGLRGKMSYSLAIARAFLGYRKREIVLKWNNKEQRKKVLMIAFCNGCQFGHGLTIYPYGELTNESLGITLIGDVSLRTYVSKLKYLKKGIPIDHPELIYDSTTEIDFCEVPADFYMELDGEICYEKVESIRVIPGSLPLIYGS